MLLMFLVDKSVNKFKQIMSLDDKQLVQSAQKFNNTGSSLEFLSYAWMMHMSVLFGLIKTNE